MQVFAVADADRKRRTAKCGCATRTALRLAFSNRSCQHGYGHEEDTMKQMRAGAFNAKCLTVLNDVQATGEPVVVTKRGKPIVKIFPI
jgi:hypothetical protein